MSTFFRNYENAMKSNTAWISVLAFIKKDKEKNITISEFIIWHFFTTTIYEDICLVHILLYFLLTKKNTYLLVLLLFLFAHWKMWSFRLKADFDWACSSLFAELYCLNSVLDWWNYKQISLTPVKKFNFTSIGHEKISSVLILVYWALLFEQWLC